MRNTRTKTTRTKEKEMRTRRISTHLPRDSLGTVVANRETRSASPKSIEYHCHRQRSELLHSSSYHDNQYQRQHHHRQHHHQKQHYRQYHDQQHNSTGVTGETVSSPRYSHPATLPPFSRIGLKPLIITWQSRGNHHRARSNALEKGQDEIYSHEALQKADWMFRYVRETREIHHINDRGLTEQGNQ